MTQPFTPGAFQNTQPQANPGGYPAVAQGYGPPMQQPPQAQPPAFGQAPQGFGAPQQPQPPAGAFGAPQGFGPQGFAPQQPAYPPAGAFGGGPQQPAVDVNAIAQRMAGAAMGASYVDTLPQGQYVGIVDKIEVGGTQQQPMIFVEVVVEASTNPGVPPGSRGKLAPIFLGASKHATEAQAFSKAIEKLGALVGCRTHEQLVQAYPNWAQQWHQPDWAKGCKVQVTSTFSKNNTNGKPLYKTTAQRIG